jgi:hypothetical protein
MTPRSTVLAALTLGALGGCTMIEGPLATPFDVPFPAPALLGPPSEAPPPADPSFAAALTDSAAAMRTLPIAEGPMAYPALRQALRLFAHALALVPARPVQREPAFQAANGLRDTAARMATTYENDPRAQIAQVRRSLAAIAGFLTEVAASDYAGSRDVLARASAFTAAAAAVDPDDQRRRVRQVKAALDAAQRTLEAMLEVVVRER